MSTQNVLQPLSCNVESPKRKRPRLDSLNSFKYSNQSWSFSFHEKPEEMLCEMGVQMLDYEEDCDGDEENCTKCVESNSTENDNKSESLSSSEVKSLSSRSSPPTSEPNSKSSVNSETNVKCSYHLKNTGCEKYAKDLVQLTVTKKPKELIDFADLNYFEMLSDEIILSIFRWLPKMMLARLATVCQRWNRLSQDDSLWTRMDVSSRYLEPGALGSIISRQCCALRLAQSEISYPAILPTTKASFPEFQSRLLYLDLSMAQITPQCLNSLLIKCNRLRKLSLEALTVNDEVCQNLSKNIDLEVVNLSMVEGLRLTGLKRIFEKCRKLRELNLAWTYLDMNVVGSISKSFPSSIERLNISGCRKTLKDDNIAEIVKSCPKLRELDLSDCTTLTEKSITFIRLLEDLNFLSLSRCYMIPYNCLLSLRTMHTLLYLDVHGGHISNQEITALQANTKVEINKFTFSSVARPTVGNRRSSIWGLRLRD